MIEDFVDCVLYICIIINIVIIKLQWNLCGYSLLQFPRFLNSVDLFANSVDVFAHSLELKYCYGNFIRHILAA